MNRKMLLAATLALLFLASWPGAGAADQEALFRFAILSDRTGGHTPGIYPRVIDAINLMNPDFVVTVGDQIEGYGEDYERSIAEWDSVLALIRGLEAPVHITPGNHDIWDDQAEAIYRDKTGLNPYYSFDYENTHFVILDNSRLDSWDELPAEQLAWLVADLSSCDKENVFVFFHKPFWDQTLRRGEPDVLHDILVRHGVDAVFCGHYHTCFSADYDGIEYTTIGSSGGVIDQEVAQPVLRGQFFQFAWVTVTSPGYELAIVGLDGVHPRDVVTFELADEIDRIESDLVDVTPIEVVAGSPAAVPVTLTIQNDSAKTLDDMVRWKVPDGWTVEPVEAHVTVPPGASHEVVFNASNPGELYPVPTLLMEYPLRRGEDLKVEKAAMIVRKLAAHRGKKTPEIDGVPSELFWERSAAATALYQGYGYSAVSGDTEFRFGHDGRGLLVAAVCHEERMDELRSTVTERDGAVYGDDCVGFFLQPNPGEMVVYQIYFNPDGVVFDQRITFDENMRYDADASWDGEYEVAGSRGDDRWSIEIRIPFEELEADIDENPTWRLNFRRKQQRTSAAADWQVPIEYDPHTYGEITFD